MGSLRNLAAFLVVELLIFPYSIGSAEPQSASTLSPDTAAQTKSLFAQSAVQVLEREFASSEVSFLLLDARTGVLLSSHWDDPEKRIPLGSLVKPFTALAYAEEHDFDYPVHFCKGEASGCWQRRGHARLGLVSAIAHSCNSYFRVLAANVSGEQMNPTARRFGLDRKSTRLNSSHVRISY